MPRRTMTGSWLQPKIMAGESTMGMLVRVQRAGSSHVSHVANQFRKYLVERAHRWVFATGPLNWVVRSRPRLVDKDAFQREAALWRRWHREQGEAERARSQG